MLLNKQSVKKLISPRLGTAEKRDFGHVLIIGGSYGMIGAVSLATRAALRSGSGLVTALVPECGYTILQTSVPEAMVMGTGDTTHLEVVPEISSYNYIAVGPGLGLNEGTMLFLDVLLHNNKPLVIDADALNIIAAKKWQHRIPKGSVITPNIREFKRLFVEDENVETIDQIQEEKARELGIYILLKGAQTRIVSPKGETHTNTTGNPGMAKAGSGDVLTGIIVGLWGRLNNLEHALLTGVCLHGLAADFASLEFHQEGMIATDLINCLPKAFQELDK